MSEITLIEAPFHLGLENVAVGRGPTVLLHAGADKALATANVIHIRKRERDCEGLDAVVDVNRQIRYAVREVREQGGLPVVVAGNCNSCLGTVAGLEDGPVGVLWFDAHGDFNTEETTISGALEGMALAALVGDSQLALRERIGFHQLVRHEDVVLVGARNLDPEEEERLTRSNVVFLPDAEGLEHAMGELTGRVSTVYVHLDIDVLNVEESPGVNLSAPGGMTVAQLEEILRQMADALPVGAFALTNYNPDHDIEKRTEQVALRLLRALI
jgi:arginase